MSPWPGTRRHSPRLLAACSALALVAGVACKSGPDPGRVIVLGVDGLDPGTIELLAAEGQLPNLARLRDHGAFGRLESRQPLLSPVVWTTIATGQPLERHGIGHFTAIDPRTGERSPVTSDLRRVKALWGIASDRGVSVSVIGWWATWPPEAVRGALVSDRISYHFLLDREATRGPAESLTYPPELATRIRPLLRRAEDVSPAELARFFGESSDPLARPFGFGDDIAHFRWALAAADTNTRIALRLWREDRPRLLMVYVEALDTASHLFGHLFRGRGLSGELADQQRHFGRTVEEAYRYVDELVGEFVAAADPSTTLLVVSDHGFTLGELPEDPSVTRDLRRVSEKYHRMDGTILAHGRGVRSGRVVGATILDVAPSVLALLGLPTARDMPGRLLAEVFDLPRPPEVATYEGGARPGTPALRDRAVDAEILERLGALGYLGGSATASPAVAPSAATHRSIRGERNLAEADFQAGRYDSAVAAYRRLVEESPADASLRSDLAGALGALGRYGEAREQLTRALALDPLNVEALYNRGVIHEKQGHRAEAVDEYRRAAAYRPDYEPARRALLRLTGSPDPRPPRSPKEARAVVLAAQARELARRGDYPGAMTQLDEAERLAPRSVVVFQNRANVAYLMGDYPGAVHALRRALALEPDNELFRRNLEQLERKPATSIR